MAKRFSIEAMFKAVDKVTKPVTRMGLRVNRVTRSMNRGYQRLSRGVRKFTNGLKKAAAITAVSLALVTSAMASTIITGANFEQAITNVGAVALKTRAQIAPLEQMALQLGRTTKFTATQSAQAMEILARSGFSTQQILKATPAILDAAAASGLEIAEVADHVSNVLKGMGLEIGRAAEVADVLALASSRTNSTIGTLGESMRNVAATARQLKIPLTETVAAVALLQDVGLDASVAGSAFNTMLTKMAAPTDSIKKKMKAFGVTFKDSKGDMLPFVKVIEQLNKASKKAGGSFDKVAFLAELVGLRGQKAAANLADLFETGRLEDLIKILKNADGSARKMANIRMDTTLGSFLLLRSAIDGVQTKLFNMNSGPLKDTIDLMTTWVNANENLIATNVSEYIDKIINNSATIFKWIKGIGIGVAVFGTLLFAMKTFLLIMGVIGAVMAAPITATVIAVTALISLIGILIAKFASFKKLKDFTLFGFGKDFAGREDEENENNKSSQVISPNARFAQSIEEHNTKSSAELTIKDETGRGRVTKGKLGQGLILDQSGAF